MYTFMKYFPSSK